MRKGLTCSEAGKLGAIASANISKIKKQNRIDIYNENPKLCKYCGSALTYKNRINNFCNQSCGAKNSNLEKGFDSENRTFNCLFCLQEFKTKQWRKPKYCSTVCMSSFWWEQTKSELLEVGTDRSCNHRTAKKYLLELYEGKCQICNLSTWNGQKMPLVLDHINGNSDDGSLSNLRVICNNCDALTDTYKYKNKGNGRAKRRQRYKDGKSY